jgi:uncharacterized repeat protein (TIGR03803 family)
MEGLLVELRANLALVAVTLCVAGTAASQEKVLHSFNNADGANPYASLISDHAGNLYGTTYAGGAYGYGAVFELRPKSGGGWAERVLHSFNNNGTDGFQPYSGLMFDTSGNLYGTTYEGGANSVGTAFELAPKGGGVWMEAVLYSFNDNFKDGYFPYAGLILDAEGNLYSTTVAGSGSGTCGVGIGCGAVFELTPSAGGSWTETLFGFNEPNGGDPYASLILDAAGNLYGTTSDGGPDNAGTAFELTREAGGGWTETVLHNFGTNENDGVAPHADLIFDASGNLYGTTYAGGGLDGYGTVFELAPSAGGGWTETVLHAFEDDGTDGLNPYAGVILGTHGKLYGTTSAGGAHGYGAVFELTSAGGGGWTEKVLHSFNGKNGSNPHASLILDTAGNLYGTTESGGTYGYGTVFEIKH